MDSEILIRPSRADDIAKLRTCMAAIWHETYDGFIGAKRVERFVSLWLTDQQLRKEAESDAILSLLVVDGDEIVGQILMREVEPGIVRVARLYLASRYHGLGLGKQMLDEGIAAFPQAHLVRLEVYEPNHRAVRFYQAYGFVEKARAPSEFAPEGVNEILMELTL